MIKELLKNYQKIGKNRFQDNYSRYITMCRNYVNDLKKLLIKII